MRKTGLAALAAGFLAWTPAAMADEGLNTPTGRFSAIGPCL